MEHVPTSSAAAPRRPHLTRGDAMTDSTSTDANSAENVPSEEPYDPAKDPDSDPESLSSSASTQPDQAEGEDDPAETS